MKLMIRVKLSADLILATPSSGDGIFTGRRIAALRQCSFYSAYASQKLQRQTNLRIQKISSESSSIFSRRVEKQNEALAVAWRRPHEIPYEAKYANRVELIGYVAIPVLFEAESDGKHFSTTLITVGNRDDRKSSSIPVVFEGELAHVVACHVKKNNCVFILGKLSVDPRRMISNGSMGKLHVLVEKLNFVERFGNNCVDEKLGFPFSFGEIEYPGNQGGKAGVNNDLYVTQQMSIPVGNSNEKSSSFKDRVGQSLESESYSESLSLMLHQKRKKQSKNKKRDKNLHLWRDLVKNPLQWWDYRVHKTNGLVNENFPDFKQKTTGDSLWVNSAPEFVLAGLGKLKCDVKDLNSMHVQGEEGLGGARTKNGTNDDSWRNLAENPGKWWDNRMNKWNPKAPDFKHKETGEALWLEDSPVCAWALSVKDGWNTSDQ